ncbi:hypothetical protein A9Q84_04580 [Halobacteriovorax marinus]|uniref:Serine protease n=1 Tax=Halobacteriovorax marinus TaxID=97084 RepID=A0A1Y5FES1_9BACT|nr:hypothetical protein A9Q84_04580 [Halobacteriovorax marinus]
MKITSAYQPKSVLLLLTLVSSLFISCGKQDETPMNGNEFFDSQIIIGDVDWREITSLTSTSAIRKASSPVADIELPVVRSRCTGFLISEDILMTNEHCIPTADHAEGVKASFRHLKGMAESSWETFDCSTFVLNNKELDFALLKCAGKPGRKFGFVKLDSTAKRNGTSIYIVQQNCDYYSARGCDWTKKYSKGKITEVADEYTHNADTLGGSSGSPMFDARTHKVVGLHHAGYGNNGMGRGFENYAVPMSKIVPAIKSRLPGVFGGGSSTPGTSTDRTEPNNSLSKAYKLSGKSQSVKGLKISSSSDKDYFSLKAVTGSKVSVKTKFTHSAGDLDVYQVDASGKVMNKVESSNNDEEFSFTANGKTAYFVVFGYKGARNTYSLEVVVKKSTASAPTSNNTISKATYLRGDQDFSESLDYKNDVDYFKFVVSRTATVKVNVSFNHSQGDLDILLINSSRKIIASSKSSKSLESISKTLAKGTYYVKVYGYKGVTNNYQLKLDK